MESIIVEKLQSMEGRTDKEGWTWTKCPRCDGRKFHYRCDGDVVFYQCGQADECTMNGAMRVQTCEP